MIGMETAFTYRRKLINQIEDHYYPKIPYCPTLTATWWTGTIGSLLFT